MLDSILRTKTRCSGSRVQGQINHWSHDNVDSRQRKKCKQIIDSVLQNSFVIWLYKLDGGVVEKEERMREKDEELDEKLL